MTTGSRQKELPQYSAATLRSLGNVDESLINYELLESLVAHVVSTQQPDSVANAILIFLPGAPEISRLVRALQVTSCKPPIFLYPIQQLTFKGKLVTEGAGLCNGSRSADWVGNFASAREASVCAVTENIKVCPLHPLKGHVAVSQGSSKLRSGASGQELRILPLHGSLPPEQQVHYSNHTHHASFWIGVR